MSYKKFQQQFKKHFKMKKGNVCSKVSVAYQNGEYKINRKVANSDKQSNHNPSTKQQSIKNNNSPNSIKKIQVQQSLKSQKNLLTKSCKKLKKLRQKQYQISESIKEANLLINEQVSQPIKNSSNKKNQNKKKKKLKSLRQVEQENKDCIICLQIPKQPRGKLPCNHIFCYQCLQQWLKKSTKCPLCRKQSEYVLVNQKKINLEKKELQQDDSDYEIQSDDQKCYLCNNGEDQNNLLICDQCDDRFCHFYCDLRLSQKPKQQQLWMCHYCSGDFDSQGQSLGGFIVNDDQISESLVSDQNLVDDNNELSGSQDFN